MRQASRGQRLWSPLGVLLLLVLLLPLPAGSVGAIEVPTAGADGYIQTNGPTGDIGLGDWYTNTTNGNPGGPGYHYLQTSGPLKSVVRPSVPVLPSFCTRPPFAETVRPANGRSPASHMPFSFPSDQAIISALQLHDGPSVQTAGVWCGVAVGVGVVTARGAAPQPQRRNSGRMAAFSPNCVARQRVRLHRAIRGVAESSSVIGSTPVRMGEQRSGFGWRSISSVKR